MDTTRLFSCNKRPTPFDFRSISNVLSHRDFSNFSSLSSSATFFPSAIVRIMTLQLSGLILCINCLSRTFSSLLFIFDDTEVRLSLQGSITINRPAIDISPDRRAPFVDMGSFVTCTKIYWPVVSTERICPSLSSGGSFSTEKF